MVNEDYERYRRETESWTPVKLIALLGGTLVFALITLWLLADRAQHTFPP